MRDYRAGLWLLVGGLLGVLVQWLSLEAIRQLVVTRTLESDDFQFFAQALGITDLVISLVLIAGALLARSPSNGRRNSWFAGAAIGFALYALLRLAPWLLQRAGVEIDFADYRHLLTGSILVHLAAYGAIALGARSGGGNRTLVNIALWLVGIRVLMTLFVKPSDTSWMTDLVSHMVGVVCALVVLAIVFDLLGAFGDDDQRTPDAHVRSATRSTSMVIAIVTMVVGIALAALAVWVTKRTSTVGGTGVTLVTATLVFAASALALMRMQRRTVDYSKFLLATLVVLGLGRLVLGAYVEPVQQVGLDSHYVPGMQIRLPSGDVEKAFEYAELGKLTVRTGHHGLGVVTLSWSPTKDPLGPFRKAAKSNGDMFTFTEDVRNTPVDGIVWTLGTRTTVYGSWRCPGENRWFMLELPSYSRNSTAARQLASRVFSTIKCDRDSRPLHSFAMPAPPGFTGTWGLELYTDDVLTRAGMTPDASQQIIRAERKQNIVESENRTVFEESDATTHKIAAVWHCFTLGIDVAIYHSGPVSESREALLAAIGSAHCPR